MKNEITKRIGKVGAEKKAKNGGSTATEAFYSKKAMSEMWWILATALIVLVVVVIILVFFKGGAEKLFGGVNTQIGALSDCDADGFRDIQDRCPCVYGTFDGCKTKEVDGEEGIKIGDDACSCSAKTEQKQN